MSIRKMIDYVDKALKYTKDCNFEKFSNNEEIVHDYEGINLNLIWDIIENDIDNLKADLEKILSENDIEEGQ